MTDEMLRKWLAEEKILGLKTVRDPRTGLLRIAVQNPKLEIEPFILRDHTNVNIAQLGMLIQTEGWIGWIRDIPTRKWYPAVGSSMTAEETMSFASGLLGVRPHVARIDGEEYELRASRRKALGVLKTVLPFLRDDKREAAMYVLNAPIGIPDTEYRPHYRGLIGRVVRNLFLHPEYIDFPLRYGVVVKEGEPLPRPFHLSMPLRYMPEGKPIYWYEGMIRWY